MSAEAAGVDTAREVAASEALIARPDAGWRRRRQSSGRASELSGSASAGGLPRLSSQRLRSRVTRRGLCNSPPSDAHRWRNTPRCYAAQQSQPDKRQQYSLEEIIQRLRASPKPSPAICSARRAVPHQRDIYRFVTIFLAKSSSSHFADGAGVDVMTGPPAGR